MYLDIRDTTATARDVKGENSRIVMIIIGSTILLTIIVCLAISPIRRLKYVLSLSHHPHAAALHPTNDLAGKEPTKLTFSSQMRERRLERIPEKAPCPDSPHSHIHTFPEEPTSVDLHPDAVQIRQFTPSQPLMAIIPILRNSDTQTRRAEEGPISPRSSIESRVPMDSPGMKGQWDAELGLGEKGAERGGGVKV